MDCIIEPIEVMTALGNHSLPEYILPEQYQTRGTQHLSYLLHAIRQRQKVHFLYRKYADNTRSERTLSPYALKEWRGRWYVLGAEEKRKDKNFRVGPHQAAHPSARNIFQKRGFRPCAEV